MILKIFSTLAFLIYVTFENIRKRDIPPVEVAENPVPHPSDVSTSVNNYKTPANYSEVPFKATRSVKTMQETPAIPIRPEPKKKVDSRLSKYGTWQKAIIMQELIKPYDDRTPSLLP